MAKNTCRAVAALVAFQKTGTGFDGVWSEIHGIVDEFARRALMRNGVKAAWGDDESAVDDVVNQTAERLLELALPDAGGRFDPAKAQPGISGLRGWLWRVVERQAVDWIRLYRGGRGVKITTSGVAWNALSDNDPVESQIDRQVAKFRRPDLLPIMLECIDEIRDSFQRRILRLKLDEDLSLRDTAKRLSVSVSRVQRQLVVAYGLLRKGLERRGFDDDWLAA